MRCNKNRGQTSVPAMLVRRRLAPHKLCWWWYQQRAGCSGGSSFAGTSQAQVGVGVSLKGRKRFYKAVSVDERGGGFEVLLDGRAVKTPKQLPLRLSTESLAMAVAAEWARQGDELEPDTMPLMALSSIALQTTETSRRATEANLLSYVETDTTMVRVELDEDPELHGQ